MAATISKRLPDNSRILEYLSCLPSTLSWVLRYYLPEIAKIFRIRTMPRNRVQHQKGLSDDAFERSIRRRRPVARLGSRGAALRASSVRGAQPQRIARSAGVNCCNAGTAATRVH